MEPQVNSWSHSPPATLGVEQQLLILTHSVDATTDFLLLRGMSSQSERDKVFRFNYDLMGEYKLEIGENDFTILDPVGRQISLATTRKAYLRKPCQESGLSGEAAYAASERWACYSLLIKLLWRTKRLVLVEPGCERTRLDKFVQATFARKFFAVPRSRLCQGVEALEFGTDAVVKSLSSENLGDTGLFTTRVDPSQLDPRYVWFVQDYIDARFDLTVVYVRGKCFAYSLERTFLDDTVDWRAWRDSRSPLGTKWTPERSLPKAFETAIDAFMRKLSLDFGRLDFLWDGADGWTFCEVNPNGQFAWLDLNNETGLLGAIAHEVSPETAVHPITYYPFPEEEPT